MLSYRSSDEARSDRAQQQRLVTALDAASTALRSDECGAWTVFGKHGHIYTWGKSGGWLIYVTCKSPRHWSATKAKLSFCTVTQDGDDEACLKLPELPTPEQAAVIRGCLGIRKGTAYSAEELERRTARIKEGVLAAQKRETEMPGTTLPETLPEMEEVA